MTASSMVQLSLESQPQSRDNSIAIIDELGSSGYDLDKDKNKVSFKRARIGKVESKVI